MSVRFMLSCSYMNQSMSHGLSVSVVIPAYNEQDDIETCLKALMKQTVKPLEIIVVDNNCTDDTAEIARSFGANIVVECKQGIAYSRTAGFDAAKGDIIARTDADSIPSETWVQAISAAFEKHPSVMAMTGYTKVHELSRSPIGDFKRFLPTLSVVHRLLFKGYILYGFNMAIRRSLWTKIRSEVIAKNGMSNEDIQLSIIVRKYYPVFIEPTMIASCKVREFLRPRKLLRYFRDDARTIRSLWFRS